MFKVIYILLFLLNLFIGFHGKIDVLNIFAAAFMCIFIVKVIKS